MKIARFGDHASPFTVAGGNGTGRQNDDVVHVARQLQHAGHQVDACARRALLRNNYSASDLFVTTIRHYAMVRARVAPRP